MRLGLIAGNGRFPFLVLDAARRAGHHVTIVAFKEETFPELAEVAARPPAADMHWVSLGQLGKWSKLLREAGITEAVMAGQVKHTKLFSDIVRFAFPNGASAAPGAPPCKQQPKFNISGEESQYPHLKPR